MQKRVIPLHLLLLVLIVTACSPASQQAEASVATVTTVLPTTSVPTAVPPTNIVAPSPTTAPSATLSPSPTSAPTQVVTTAATERTVQAAAVDAAADRWALYAQFTIEGLRNRAYGKGQIEIVRTLETTGQFTRYLIAYPSDGLRITGMLNRPKGNGPFPVVILNHGYYPLDVYQTGNGTKLAADYLATRGFLTLSPDFRSHAGSTSAPNQFRAGHVIDTLNLIPLAQQLPYAQKGKVGMWGHSNGGAITAKAIATSNQIAVALIYAPASSNITEDYQFRVERARSRGQQIDPIEWPVKPDQGPDLYQRLSPLPYLRYVQTPVQLHWGTADETVPRKWPQDLYNGLIAAGKQATFFVYNNQPHSFQGAGNQLYLRRMADFFTQYLKR